MAEFFEIKTIPIMTKNQKVVMADGTVKSIKDIQHGDKLLGSNGKPIIVRNKKQ